MRMVCSKMYIDKSIKLELQIDFKNYKKENKNVRKLVYNFIKKCGIDDRAKERRVEERRVEESRRLIDNRCCERRHLIDERI